MEALLNLLWLVIAVATVVLWRTGWRGAERPSRAHWIALACALFLLFPVISLTDDLHDEVFVVECATGTKHFLSNGHAGFANGHAVRPAGAAAPAILPRSAQSVALFAFGRVASHSFAPVSLSVLPFSGLSPPLQSR